MRHQKRHSKNEADQNSSRRPQEDPGKEGLKLLAKMIARVYLDEIAVQRQIMRGAKPRMHVEKIYIAAGSKNINDQKERYRLHIILDEDLDLMTHKMIAGDRSPWVFEKDGIAIKIRV